jgi:hypothetical protein
MRQGLIKHRQQHVARPDRGGHRLHEAVAQMDRVNDLEDLALAEMLRQPVEQPASRIGGLFPPVA